MSATPIHLPKSGGEAWNRPIKENLTLTSVQSNADLVIPMSLSPV
jgi:hypothetical protein